ncbi:unnamed protein product [Adineta ricciae]|uniref:Uncharacterized protein n=1 Tax=Adineta ricciae TaxID=249248 RepID=A0A815NAX8_ADIRI|nr:unnamed protein product [Adineta ricciae]
MATSATKARYATYAKDHRQQLSQQFDQIEMTRDLLSSNTNRTHRQPTKSFTHRSHQPMGTRLDQSHQKINSRRSKTTRTDIYNLSLIGNGKEIE